MSVNENTEFLYFGDFYRFLFIQYMFSLCLQLGSVKVTSNCKVVKYLSTSALPYIPRSTNAIVQFEVLLIFLREGLFVRMTLWPGCVCFP